MHLDNLFDVLMFCRVVEPSYVPGENYTQMMKQPWITPISDKTLNTALFSALFTKR
jgi:hypothetical protein